MNTLAPCSVAMRASVLIRSSAETIPVEGTSSAAVASMCGSARTNRGAIHDSQARRRRSRGRFPQAARVPLSASRRARPQVCRNCGAARDARRKIHKASDCPQRTTALSASREDSKCPNESRRCCACSRPCPAVASARREKRRSSAAKPRAPRRSPPRRRR